MAEHVVLKCVALSRCRLTMMSYPGSELENVRREPAVSPSGSFRHRHRMCVCVGGEAAGDMRDDLLSGWRLMATQCKSEIALAGKSNRGRSYLKDQQYHLHSAIEE